MKKSSIFKIIITLLLLTSIHPQTNIFPETFKAADEVFQTTPSTKFLYKAGYFTSKSTNLFINRQAIVLNFYTATSFVNILYKH